MRTDIKWAGSIEARSDAGQQGFAVGAPDCNSRGLFEGQFATFTNWRRASYDGLEELLGTVVAGEAVSPDMLAGSDVVAFEMNGSSPGFVGGWESVDVTFRDSQNEVRVHWIDQPGAPRDPHVIANGSISGDRYGAFFGIPPEQVIFGEPALTPDRVVVSFLLFKVRGEIDVTGPAFRLTLTSPPGLGASPDPDAVGVLLHGAAQPDRRIKPAKSPTMQVLDLCQKLRTEDAISPALVAVWQRRLGGLPPRGPFEEHIYDTFDRMPLDSHALLEQGFARFAEFRALGTDTCLFSDRLADVVAQRPLEPAEFAEELLLAGLGVVTQALTPAAKGTPGPGLRRPWVSVGPETAGVHPPVPTPHITAVRHDLTSMSEFISSSSWFPPPGQPFLPQDYQFAKECQVKPTLDGVVQDCHVVTATAPPGAPVGLFPILACEGGRDYSFGSSCLKLLATAAGTTLVLRGFNFITPQVTVHLRPHDRPDAPVSSVEALVLGDRTTPAVDQDGKTIADARVEDYVDVHLPTEEPGSVDTPFRPGLYDVWVTVTDAPDPADPASPAQQVTRDSNVMVVRIEPRPDLTFEVVNSAGRCEEATSGPGDDEIWWTAFVGSVVPGDVPVAPGEHSVLRVPELRPVQLNFDAWTDMSSGAAAAYPPEVLLWPARPFKLGEVGIIGLLGLEVDDEDEAREMLRGFWDAFGEALKVVALGAIASISAGDTALKVLEKVGVQVTVSVTAILLGAVIAAAVTFTAMCLWSAWAPADIVGFDVFTFDALTLALATDGLQPLPAATERSWRLEGEWQRVRERPQPKVGTPGSTTMTWVQQNEYLSGAEDSRYVLEFRARQTRVPS